MQIISSHSGKSRIVRVPVDGNGSDIQAGALVTMGVTAASNMGAFIVSGAAAADAFGILLKKHTSSSDVDSTIEDGLLRTLADVEMLCPGDLVAAEYDQTDTVAIATGGTATVIITGSDEETGCYHYYVAGTAIGQLAYIKSYSGDTATYKSALTTAVVANDTVIRLLAPGRTLVKLNSTADKFGTDAADGTADFLVLRNEMTYDGCPGWVELDYTKHHNLQLNGKNAKFRAVGCFTNMAVSPIA